MADTIVVSCAHCGASFQRPKARGSAIKHCSDSCRFWSKVSKSLDPGACWNWTGSTDKTRNGGYGMFAVGGGRSVRAHRWAYESGGDRIPEGMMVCHKCDNPMCCNPAHLFVGSAKVNNDDKMAKGRHGMTPEVIARMAATKRGKPVPPSVLLAAIAANTGKRRPPEVVERMRAAHLGAKRSEETRAKLRAAWIRRKERIAAGKM